MEDLKAFTVTVKDCYSRGASKGTVNIKLQVKISYDDSYTTVAMSV